ncbi:carboxypeptidase-like regulatory domain-containing protein [Hymenobacter sp. H14-R3]|uniref:carboxypeptidase-like regulatory domain-containing protein n=1 Tax=Hymenobacter sp. H14-R3 TaxID=3046308 RepID=UPI0024BA30F8|nr:carboxypeptidase-like regulatory domain-containing protein [Hymenobacter sp. H14-R3]MDJ0365094.1 carboxypeptidase-like regulatory domain-containing protein [Hymenobacter sp. H14-R3]
MKVLQFILVVGCWLALAGGAQAQGRITGVVQDSVTHQPLAFASVFLANTTLGATTTEQGQFEFLKVPAGTYDVVGSYVGYRLGKQVVTVTNPKAPQEITILLGSSGPQLEEVVVQASAHRPEDYKKFSDLFLGQSTFSQQCEITNPRDIVVYTNDSTKELTASAKNFVQVENQALGYRLKYFGMFFTYNPDTDFVGFSGQPVFEEMTPRDAAQQRQWQQNRVAAYTGSFRQFLRSVYNNRLKADGFLTQQVRLVPNRRFELTDSLRRRLQRRRADGNFTSAERDSLTKWEDAAPVVATLYPTARPIDSVRYVSADGRHTYLRFTQELQVCHFGEAPDPRYDQAMSTIGPEPRKSPYPAKRQVSRIRLQGREAEIQPNGSLRNSSAVSTGEYWGFEKIGEFLPFDYDPAAAVTATKATP